MRITLGSLELRNPVMPASGTYGLESVPYVNPNLLGAVVTRSITLHPEAGPPSPRMLETASGLLSAAEVQSAGVQAFVRHELPQWRKFDVPLIVNIAGKSSEELCKLAAALAKEKGIAALELNLSHLHGYVRDSFIESVSGLLRQLKHLTSLPIVAKLFSHPELERLAQTCEESGADAVSLIHGLSGVALDSQAGVPKLGGGAGILTGPAIKPLALHLVQEVRRWVKLPMIGMGGIFSAQDAREFLQAGAQAVAVGTAGFVNPCALAEIVKELRSHFKTSWMSF